MTYMNSICLLQWQTQNVLSMHPLASFLVTPTCKVHSCKNSLLDEGRCFLFLLKMFMIILDAVNWQSSLFFHIILIAEN